MKPQRMNVAVALALGAMFLGALAVVTTASPASAQISFNVTVAPPALRVETRTAQPSPRHVWVSGYWQFSGGQYVWTPGRWDTPAQAGATWQAASWSQVGGRWVFTPGRWVGGGGSVAVQVGAPTGTVSGTVTQGTSAVGVAALHPPTPTVGGNVVVQGQPGQVVVQQPAAGAGIVVNVAPPAVRFERRGPPPGAGVIWIPGYWQWNGGQYTWVAGRWQAPQQQGAVWVGPRWQRRGRGWVFVEGRWRGGRGPVVVVQQPPTPTVVVQQPPTPTVVVQQQPPVGTVEVTVAPPALQVEQQGAQPSPTHVWIRGYWQWNGSQYQWVRGRWESPREAGAVWIAPQWQRRGRGWIFVQGRWGGGRRHGGDHDRGHDDDHGEHGGGRGH